MLRTPLLAHASARAAGAARVAGCARRGYASDTAGASFNTNHQPFLHTIQAAFDRDWNSSYAVDLRTFIDTQGLAACRGRSTQADIHPSDTQACEDVLRQLMKQ